MEFLTKPFDIQQYLHKKDYQVSWLIVFTQELTVFTPVDAVLFRRVNSLQVDVSYLLSLLQPLVNVLHQWMLFCSDG